MHAGAREVCTGGVHVVWTINVILFIIITIVEGLVRALGARAPQRDDGATQPLRPGEAGLSE